MRIKNLKEYYLKNRNVVTDEQEGGRYEAFSPVPISIRANIYDKDSSITSSIGGFVRKREKRMLMEAENVECIYDNNTRQEEYRFADGNFMRVGDGICVYVPADSEPDYRISNIRLAGHFVCTLERI